MRPASPNDFGLTATATYDDMLNSATLSQQLAARSVPHATTELPDIVGLGGCAAVITYTRQKTGQPVAVLVVPHRYDVDRFAEDYFYFQGMDVDAVAAADWVGLYDRCTALTRQENRS